MCADIATSFISGTHVSTNAQCIPRKYIAIDEFCREQHSGGKAREGEAGHTRSPNSLHNERRDQIPGQGSAAAAELVIAGYGGGFTSKCVLSLPC